ncbi:MAG: M48 family metallopeptidase [Tannerellaceae bacterium]|jgi:predicted metal-dependent hydrolase|nr:M48 family metallopeptidase [Tannerellaceae bacterium]
MKTKLYDKELGTITLQTNVRAKKYSLKVSNGAIVATMPPGGKIKTLTAFIEENREALMEALQKYPVKKAILDDSTDIQANTFKLHIFRTDRENFYMTLDKGILHIACPKETAFEEERVQQLLKAFIEKALRHEAKRILPSRLDELAKQHQFSYTSVTIRNTKSRWGSCSSKAHINLSLSLMLLPDPLINYVILHELCHTVEMNHSERFWQLMNRVTDNKALALRKELKAHRML